MKPYTSFFNTDNYLHKIDIKQKIPKNDKSGFDTNGLEQTRPKTTKNRSRKKYKKKIKIRINNISKRSNYYQLAY